jgi:hypothetical protein
MNKGFLIRFAICIFIFGIFLYKYINVTNTLTKQKLFLPKIEKEISLIREDNKRLQYLIEQFENPAHLIELSRSPEYIHLKHPLLKDVLKVREGVALKENKKEKSEYIIDDNSSFSTDRD